MEYTTSSDSKLKIKRKHILYKSIKADFVDGPSFKNYKRKIEASLLLVHFFGGGGGGGERGAVYNMFFFFHNKFAICINCFHLHLLRDKFSRY